MKKIDGRTNVREEIRDEQLEKLGKKFYKINSILNQSKYLNDVLQAYIYRLTTSQLKNSKLK